MFDNCALHNAPLPRGRWLALLFVGGIMVLLLIHLLPQSTPGDVAGAVLGVVVNAILIVVVAVVAFEHLATARTLRLGNPLNAMVAHTRRSVWGMGTSGQTWHVTLRYEIGGRTIESERSVPEEVYRRCHAGSQVEVRVMSRWPKRWAMPELATKQSPVPVLTIEQRRAQMPGVIAFVLLAVPLVAIGVAGVSRAPLGLIMSAALAAASCWIAAKWRRGEGRLAGGCMIGFLVIYTGPIALAVALAPDKLGANVDAALAVALIALAAAMTFATLVLVIDARQRARHNAVKV